MENASSNTWTALRNSVFRRFWLATVISGSCVAAQNTAIYWALNALGATTVLISLMATVSALPGWGNRRHSRPQEDLVSSSALADLYRFRSRDSMGGAPTESLSHLGEYV